MEKKGTSASPATAFASRVYKQCTFGNFSTEVGVAFWVLEKLYYFFNLGLCFGESGDIAEGHALGVVFVEQHGFGFSYAEDSATTAGSAAATGTGHAPHKENPYADEEGEGQNRPQQGGERAALFVFHRAVEGSHGAPFLDLVG